MQWRISLLGPEDQSLWYLVNEDHHHDDEDHHHEDECIGIRFVGIPCAHDLKNDDEDHNNDDEGYNHDDGSDGDDADLRIMMMNLTTKMATKIMLVNLLESSEAVEGRHFGQSWVFRKLNCKKLPVIAVYQTQDSHLNV